MWCVCVRSFVYVVQQFPLTPCKFYATMVADSSDSVLTIRFRLVKRFLRSEITGRLLESELML